MHDDTVVPRTLSDLNCVCANFMAAIGDPIVGTAHPLNVPSAPSCQPECWYMTKWRVDLAQGAWSIGVFKGSSPFALEPLERLRPRADLSGAWPVSNPVLTCASITGADSTAKPADELQTCGMPFAPPASISLHHDHDLAKRWP